MLFDQIESNVHKSWALLGVFILVLLALGYVIGQVYNFAYGGMALAAFAAAVASWVSYYHSDTLVLTVSGAGEVNRELEPFLVNTVEGLAIAAQIPPPRVYLINDPAPNSFATGRDPQHAAIVVTRGLLDKLDREEVEGVVAHEISHIENFDVRFSTIAAVMVGTVAFISDAFLRSLRYGIGDRDRDREDAKTTVLILLVAIVFAILAPTVATLIQLAISRQREYLADMNGARLTRNPEGLARALEKLEADQEPLAAANKATAHMYIVNPLHDWGGTINGWFDTHPPIEDRIRRLRALEGAVQPQQPALNAMPARTASSPGAPIGGGAPGSGSAGSGPASAPPR